MPQTTFTLDINENIDFKSTKELIAQYQESLKTGVFYDIIEISIKSKETKINGEIDPIFISYQFFI